MEGGKRKLLGQGLGGGMEKLAEEGKKVLKEKDWGHLRGRWEKEERSRSEFGFAEKKKR